MAENILDGYQDPLFRLQVERIETSLKLASQARQQITGDTNSILWLSTCLLASVADSLSYLIQSKNHRLFTTWLQNNKQIDPSVKEYVIGYLLPLKEFLEK